MTTVHNADPPRRFQELAHELDVPLLRGPRDTMLALAAVVGRRAYETAQPREPAPDVSDLLEGTGALSEHESALVLERAGVPFAARRLAATPEEAAAATDEIGTPVVVKLDRPRTRRARMASSSASPPRTKPPRRPASSAWQCSSPARPTPAPKCCAG